MRVSMSKKTNDRERRREGKRKEEKDNVRQKNKLIQRIQRNNDGKYTRHEEQKKKTNGALHQQKDSARAHISFVRSSQLRSA